MVLLNIRYWLSNVVRILNIKDGCDSTVSLNQHHSSWSLLKVVSPAFPTATTGLHQRRTRPNRHRP
jgi:hypothetical protein